jgi:hypothetical protein
MSALFPGLALPISVVLVDLRNVCRPEEEVPPNGFVYESVGRARKRYRADIIARVSPPRKRGQVGKNNSKIVSAFVISTSPAVAGDGNENHAHIRHATTY